MSFRLKGASERFNLLLPLHCNPPRVCQAPSQHEWGPEGEQGMGGFASDEVSWTVSCAGGSWEGPPIPHPPYPASLTPHPSPPISLIPHPSSVDQDAASAGLGSAALSSEASGDFTPPPLTSSWEAFPYRKMHEVVKYFPMSGWSFPFPNLISLCLWFRWLFKERKKSLFLTVYFFSSLKHLTLLLSR